MPFCENDLEASWEELLELSGPGAGTVSASVEFDESVQGVLCVAHSSGGQPRRHARMKCSLRRGDVVLMFRNERDETVQACVELTAEGTDAPIAVHRSGAALSSELRIDIPARLSFRARAGLAQKVKGFFGRNYSAQYVPLMVRLATEAGEPPSAEHRALVTARVVAGEYFTPQLARSLPLRKSRPRLRADTDQGVCILMASLISTPNPPTT